MIKKREGTMIKHGDLLGYYISTLDSVVAHMYNTAGNKEGTIAGIEGQAEGPLSELGRLGRRACWTAL